MTVQYTASMTKSTRALFRTLVTGSHLYGTEGEGSDYDTIDLVFPTLKELVANRQVTIPHVVSQKIDVRTHLLGDFVMSLGSNPEHTLLAAHYFPELHDYFLVQEVPVSLLTVARRMYENARTPAMAAHAYRYAVAAEKLNEGLTRLYPMGPMERASFLRFKNLETIPDMGDYFEDTAEILDEYVSDLPDREINKQALAEWVWAQYQNHYNGGNNEG